jgi:hypothetical protein
MKKSFGKDGQPVHLQLIGAAKMQSAHEALKVATPAQLERMPEGGQWIVSGRNLIKANENIMKDLLKGKVGAAGAGWGPDAAAADAADDDDADSVSTHSSDPDSGDGDGGAGKKAAKEARRAARKAKKEAEEESDADGPFQREVKAGDAESEAEAATALTTEAIRGAPLMAGISVRTKVPNAIARYTRANHGTALPLSVNRLGYDYMGGLRRYAPILRRIYT